MGVAAAEQALEKYNVAYIAMLPVQKGYRNESYAAETIDHGFCNLIIYKREPGILGKIRCANSVSSYLAQQGMLVRHPLNPKILKLQTKHLVRYAALYNYLPGTTIPWEAYTMEHLKLLGQTMSDMHYLLASYTAPAMPLVVDEYQAILTRMGRYFQDTSVQQAVQSKLHLQINTSALARYAAILQASQNLPGQQVLHMDFVRGNVLFQKDASAGKIKLTGLLDFEKTALGHPIFDIARTLAFLLVDCKYKSAIKIKKYFLYSGYNKRGKARLGTIKSGSSTLLEELVSLFLTYDFYKFLCHNPYEFLHQNEHFVRTKNILLERNIVTSSDRIKERQEGR